MKKILLLWFTVIALSGKAQIKFERSYGQPTSILSTATSAAQTYDGGYIVAGDLDTGTSVMASLVRTNVLGNMRWSRTFYSQNNNTHFSAVIETSDSGFVVTGMSGDDLLLFKIDSIGNIVWEKYFRNNNLDPTKGQAIHQTADGGLIVTGNTAHPFEDVFLLRADKSGNLLWAKSYGGVQQEAGNDVRQTNDGGFIVCGYTKSFGQGNRDGLLLKTDSTGNLSWSKVYGGINDDYLKSIHICSDGGFVTTGSLSSLLGGLPIMKTNPTGDTLWIKTYDLEPGEFLNLTNDGFIITGQNYLIKTDTSGSMLWCKQFDFPFPFFVQQTNDMGFILAGGYTCCFYFAKTNSNGETGCETNLYPNAYNTNIQVNASAFQVTSGAVSTNLFLTHGIITVETHYCSTSGIYTVDENEIEKIFITRNPATNRFAIRSAQPITQIEIFNTLGEKIYSARVDNSSEQITCEL